MIADTEKIRLLLESPLTDYRIAKETGITKATIGNMRRESTNLMKMQLHNAIKLTNLWEKHKQDKYLEIKRFIEDDLQDKGLIQELNEFSIDSLFDNETVQTGKKGDKNDIYISLHDLSLDNAIKTHKIPYGDKAFHIYYVR